MSCGTLLTVHHMHLGSYARYQGILRHAGGFKLWECAVDLANFLCQHFDIRSSQEDGSQKVSSPSDLTGTSVLELGCGQGLPGILLALCGATVHFQVLS